MTKFVAFDVRHGSRPIPAVSQLAALPKRTCGACGQVFQTRRERNDHLFLVHNDGERFGFMRSCASEAIARRPDLQAEWLADMARPGAASCADEHIAAVRDADLDRWNRLQAEWDIEPAQVLRAIRMGKQA